ncbi:MAG: transcription elongation factor GreA [Candidatus Caccosoma sp.]|nr:transcription elongation factor GreA [Candidatus Caccosoma sp.]
MANIKKEVVTKEYYDELKAQYRELIDVLRPQVLEELATARSQGDLSENADYDAARSKQAEIEARIKDLEFTLNNVEVASEKASKNKVTATSTVIVYDEDDDAEYTYQLVGSIGSDPEKGKITTESSLGAALLGKEVGNEIEIICGDGSSYKVVIKQIK